MGNTKSCFYTKSSSVKLIDLNRNILQIVSAPVTAAELMLENTGHVISPAAKVRSNNRFSAMKADDLLSGGCVYLLIPVNRINGRVSASEMAVIDSACGDRKVKRRSSKIQPVVNETTSNSNNSLSESGEIRMLNSRTRQWRPVLEPIHENI